MQLPYGQVKVGGQRLPTTSHCFQDFFECPDQGVHGDVFGVGVDPKHGDGLMAAASVGGFAILVRYWFLLFHGLATFFGSHRSLNELPLLVEARGVVLPILDGRDGPAAVFEQLRSGGR